MSQNILEKLDAPTRVKLRSTQILTSLPQIVSELVQNSLDAGSTLIDVGVDCEEWTCWVRDNGSGISKEGLSTLGLGSEEGRYGTSKSYTLHPQTSGCSPTFGFRGEALASAAELSCVEISSRTKNSRETWSIIIKGGKNLYSGTAVRWRRESAGTVVCIRDAFYNLPVRRLSHPPPTRTFELIRQEIETFCLVLPHIAFSLENLSDGREAGSSKGKIIRIPKTSSMLGSFRNLYGRALTEHIEEVKLTSGKIQLEGFISLNGAHSKSYQFLYVNRHPIARCDLHYLIESRFALSSFSKNALDEAGETCLPRSTIRRSPRKMEKKPVYVLNLTIPPQEIDNCLEPAKTNLHFQDRSAVTTLLSSFVSSFLTRHGFSPQDNDYPKDTSPSPSPRKRRKIDFEGDSGYGEEPIIDASATIEESSPNEIKYPNELIFMNDSPDDITWTDSNTAETFVVDRRTGNSHPLFKPPINVEDDPFRQPHPSRRTIPGHIQGTAPDESPIPNWLQKALKSNQSYEVAEEGIPALKPSTSGFGREKFFNDHSRGHHCDTAGPEAAGASQSIVDAELNAALHRFQKADLRRAQVINQVDRKFIACLIETQPNTDNDSQNPPPSGRALVLIDQHAADERVRVERFLKELCLGFLYNRQQGADAGMGVLTRELSPPLPLLLTHHEAQRLEASSEIRDAFRHWGFSFVDFPDNAEILGVGNQSNTGYTQVMIKAIPEVIGDKLLLGDELRDLVKGFLGRLDAGLPSFVNAAAQNIEDTGEFSWLKALRWCPRELLDLVNSKACRGAIMFNDILSLDQSQKLIQALADTAFPFQCAHGRPSLVPLANVGIFNKRHVREYEWSRLES